MTNAEKYFQEKMKDPNFKEIYLQEKFKLDLEFQLDELKEQIKIRKSKTTLIRGVNKIKKSLEIV